MLQLSFVNFKKNSYIYVAGQATNDRFLIIQSGSVRTISAYATGSDKPTICGPGDFVGVIACMASQRQIETAIATTDVVAISVKKDQYTDLITKNTPVAMKIIRTFATQMRSVNELLTQLTLKSTVASNPEEMYSIAKFYDDMGQNNCAIYGYYQYMKACPQGTNIALAKKRFVTLKPRSEAVYFETGNEGVRIYPKGTMIFSECQTGNDMYIIQSGQVKISKVVDNNEVILAVLPKGEFFGEMALLENLPRSASAIAHEDTTLMVVNRKNFVQMVATQAQLIARLTTTLAERLWSMSRQVANSQLRDPQHKLIDMLALQLEKARVAVGPATNYLFDFTLYDLANMCGIPKEQQGIVLGAFIKNDNIKRKEEKIYVMDCQRLMKDAEFFRKQVTKSQ